MPGTQITSNRKSPLIRTALIVASVAAASLMLTPAAHAWWRHGFRVGIVAPLVAPPVYYGPPPAYYPPPAYAYYGPPAYYPRRARIWVRAHRNWAGAWIRGHYAWR